MSEKETPRPSAVVGQILVLLDWTEGRRLTAELLERFDLVEAAGKPVATYSGGMCADSTSR
jgi:ABC-type multidrug transport system ATPase subunit